MLACIRCGGDLIALLLVHGGVAVAGIFVDGTNDVAATSDSSGGKKGAGHGRSWTIPECLTLAMAANEA